MDSVIEYRRIVRDLIRRSAEDPVGIPGLDVESVFDERNDHYELIYTGWDGPRRVHGSVLHLDIRDGKIWIQHDGTHHGIANDLVEAGVPKYRIVLAFKPPAVRQYTGYATS